MICEICGKRKATRIVVIEGAQIEVCDSCGKADPVQPKSKPKLARREKVITHRLRDDARSRIEEFMKSKGLDIRGLSLLTKISERDLNSILANRLVDLHLIRKLEKVIGKELLIEEIILESAEEDSNTQRTNSITLESFLEEDRDGK